MSNNTKLIAELKDIIQDCNINFLIGSGMSTPYISLLGNIEKLLTDLSNKDNIKRDHEKIIRASLYQHFFDNVIIKNRDIFKHPSKIENKEIDSILKNYINFLKIINTIILNRRSAILSRQINIFTTNFDIFFEKSFEMANVEYNDGFSGSFNRKFILSNFKKSIFKRSLHYDNIYELPVFNLIKLHGSLTWRKKYEDGIYFDKNLSLLKCLDKIRKNQSNKPIKIFQETTIDKLLSLIKDEKMDPSIEKFIDEYENLLIINPTKEKFRSSVLNRNYYELLRIYSTELEKENTVLFVMGFSFSDEHIREVTIRAANSNPTLKVYILAHIKKSKEKIEKEIKKSPRNNQNIRLICPEDIFIKNNEEQTKKDNSVSEFNFQNINTEIFKKILGEIHE